MKKMLRKISMVLNRKETIDFKIFCDGGSPEYVAAKQRLKNFHIVPSDFAESAFPQKKGIEGKLNFEQSSIARNSKRLKAYSLYINPAAFFDPTFIMLGAGVLAVAMLEKKLAENGLISIASFLSNILRLALPGVALASIIYLLNQASFLL